MYILHGLSSYGHIGAYMQHIYALQMREISKLLKWKYFFHVCSALFEKFCFLAEYATKLGPLIKQICKKMFCSLMIAQGITFPT